MSTRTRAAVVRIVIAVIVVAGVVWWMRSRASTSSSASRAATGTEAGSGSGGGGKGDRVVPVQVASATKKDLPIWIEGLGTVAAFQQVTVRAQVDGRLDKVLFQEGQPVKKGEVLAQIDPRPYLVQLHQAQGALARDKALLDNAKRNYERYKGLHEQNLVAQQQVDEYAGQVGQAEGAMKIDMSQVESAQLMLDYAQVKAPLDGVTGVRLIDAGNIIKASDATGLVVITQVNPAAVLFTIPQDRLPAVAAAIAKGDVIVDVYNRDGTQKLATGKVSVLDNQINTATATLRLKALVDNPGRVLWPNAFVKARMLVETRTDVLVIPTVAIQRGPQGAFVYVVGADKTAAMKPVTVTLQAGDQAIVEKGLESGDEVVIEGQNQLRPGGRVEPIRPKDKSAEGRTRSNAEGDAKSEKSEKSAGSAAGPKPPSKQPAPK
ncbi:MAG: efflux RND transporter periplasmic adaptor subunit [Kofleriaceae bacterium]